jgi:hypothetical protein
MKLTARVRFVKTEDGGRNTPLRTGARVPVLFGKRVSGRLPPELNDCRVTIVGRDWAPPGEECTVRLTPLSPDLVRPRVSNGVEIELWEGRPIALGRLIEIDYED